MALKAKHEDNEFGIGDTVNVSYIVKEAGKERTQIFQGIVIAIKGRGEGKTFTVRRVGAQKIGIERIFPLSSPNVKGIEVVREGTRGVRASKLYYLREKSKKQSERIYKRAKKKNESKKEVKDRKSVV